MTDQFEPARTGIALATLFVAANAETEGMTPDEREKARNRAAKTQFEIMQDLSVVDLAKVAGTLAGMLGMMSMVADPADPLGQLREIGAAVVSAQQAVDDSDDTV